MENPDFGKPTMLAQPWPLKDTNFALEIYPLPHPWLQTYISNSLVTFFHVRHQGTSWDTDEVQAHIDPSRCSPVIDAVTLEELVDARAKGELELKVLMTDSQMFTSKL